MRLVQGQVGSVLADNAEGVNTGDDRFRPAAAKRAFDAMLKMQKIDVATIEEAVRGG